MLRQTASLLLILAMGATSLVLAGATLTLQDGQILQGLELKRKGNFYSLELETGGFITIPVEIVKEVALTVDGEPDGEPAIKNQATASATAGNIPGAVDADPETDNAIEADDLETAEVATRPGLPKRHEQLEAFGKPPSRFHNSVMDPSWQPSSDWDLDPAGNSFNPSRWFTPSVDPFWSPESAFDSGIDVFNSGHATWQRSIIDSSWTPSEGFKLGGSSGFTYTDETIPLVESEQYVPRVEFD
jgi:hypothetical protein